MATKAIQQLAQNRRFRAQPGPLLFLLLGLLAFPGITARAQRGEDDRVKALFLYNLAKFVEWPTSVSRETISIGIVGSDFLGPALNQTVNGKTINGRGIVVKRISDVRSAKDCHMLIISGVGEKRLRGALDAVRGASVLTVGDSDAFSTLGGIIQFKTTGAKVHFVVNLDAAERAHLKISSKLLGLSEIVHGGGE
jgi:hypothetical protein